MLTKEIIDSMTSVLNQLDDPKVICERERDYVGTDISRVNNTFNDQEAGLQIQQQLTNAVEYINHSEDLIISAIECVKGLIMRFDNK